MQNREELLEITDDEFASCAPDRKAELVSKFLEAKATPQGVPVTGYLGEAEAR